jgi:tetratricopeptide (TPR) repeat protein
MRTALIVTTALLIFLLSAMFLQAQGDSNEFEILNREVIRLYRIGNYDHGVFIGKKAIEVAEKAFGADHPYVATSLNNLGELYKAQGRYAQAELLHKRSLAIREKALGADHPYVATSLNNLGELYKAQGQYAQAELLHKRSLAIREKALGADHPDVAMSLNNLAGLYENQGQYAQAESLYKRSLAICEKDLGADHPHVATSLNNLAGLYENQGQYAQAEPLYKRSLAIREKALGADHPDVAASLNNLAGLYKTQGQYAQAEPLYKRSLAIWEKALGADHPNVAASLNNLAGLYKTQGRYAQAEPLYKRSLAICEKALGADHPHVATSLNNLGELYRIQGQYAQAESLYKRSLAIREKALGADHPDVAMSLNNLGELYKTQGQYAQAELLHKRSLAIREKALGADHPDVAMSLNNLAWFYENQGQYAQAESLYKRSLAILEKALGADHPDAALSLNNIAWVYKTQGKYAQAESLYKRSLAILEKALGTDHPKVAAILRNISDLFASQGKYRDSFELKLRVNGIYEELIDRVAGSSSGERTMQFLATIKNHRDIFLTLVTTQFREDRSAIKEAFGFLLRRKGIVLETQRRMQLALLDLGDKDAAIVFDELSIIRARISILAFADSSRIKIEILQDELKHLYEQKAALESKLSQISQPYDLSRRLSKANVDKMAEVLPKGAVLVEFARTDFFNFQATGIEKKWLPAHYLSFLLLPNKEKNVVLIDHGSADEIDQLVIDLKNALAHSDQETKVKEKSRKLHDMIFAPIQREIGVSQQIFLSPDGALNIIPFEVFQDSDGSYLIEKFTFNYLSAGRDLLGFTRKMAGTGNCILLGDPDFDLGPKSRDEILNRLALKADTAIISASSMEARGLNFERLPGTREEVIAIGELLGKDNCEIFLDKLALKEVIYSRKSPRILHLATHGFFLNTRNATSPIVNFENLLVHSGLAFAGANRMSTDSSIQARYGILTAEEVLGLPLRGTELLVLSACETGLGEVISGEGVFGLQRAFNQIGVRSLVMSMWSVPDRETKEFMVEFYQNFHGRKMDRCQALRQAALKQKSLVKQRYGKDNPFYWGAFVFLGQSK